MPRKDRRFTGQDLKRLYCKNLTPEQRHFFDILDCDWSDYSRLEKFEEVMDFLDDSGLLEDAMRMLPYGNYVEKAFRVAQFLLKGGDLTQIDYVPTMDYERLSTLGESVDLFIKGYQYQEPQAVRLLLDLIQGLEPPGTDVQFQLENQ